MMKKMMNFYLVKKMNTLEKFVKTCKTTGSYGRETRFYEALERAGLPKDATQEMVREYLES